MILTETNFRNHFSHHEDGECYKKIRSVIGKGPAWALIRGRHERVIHGENPNLKEDKTQVHKKGIELNINENTSLKIDELLRNTTL